MGRNLIETIMGAVVLAVAAVFVLFAVQTAQVRAVSGYEVTADFYKVGGLQAGSDVRINGIKVGTVTSVSLDPKTFDAIVHASIRDDIKLPKDTVAAVGSDGLMGGKHLVLKPGQSKTFLEPGGQVARTEDYKSLEDQVGEIIFLATGNKNGGDGGGGGLGGDGFGGFGDSGSGPK